MKRAQSSWLTTSDIPYFVSKNNRSEHPDYVASYVLPQKTNKYICTTYKTVLQVVDSHTLSVPTEACG